MKAVISLVSFSVVAVVAIGAFALVNYDDVTSIQSRPVTGENDSRDGADTASMDPESTLSVEADSAPSNDPADQSHDSEPINTQNFREAHGYYASGSSDVNEKHPYELYDVQTLEQLADNNDSLAQLVLADQISVEDPERADELYMESAVNGKTAALVNMAASRLLLVPGGTGFGFPLTSNSGRISDSYVEVLKYYVAAENMGDSVAGELLRSHIDALGLVNSTESLQRVCEAGNALIDRIEEKQREKWGSPRHVDPIVLSDEAPTAVCGHQLVDLTLG